MADAGNAYTQAINNALASAKGMLGKNEVPNHAEIQSYLQDGGQNLDPHKLAWCAAFVSASLQKAGLPVPTQVVKDSAFGPGAYAPNYLTYGSAVDPKSIQAGDILVANNGTHVGFAEGPIRQGQNGPEVQLLAGNERDTSGQYAPGSYTNPTTGAVANRSQVGQVGERWVPLSGYSARRYVPTNDQDGSQPSATSPTAPSPPPNTTTINSTPTQGSSVLDTMRQNIGQYESGNDYNILGKRTNTGDQAVGKYQVMKSNIPSWTQKWLGHSLTPEQFRADPQAQDAVFNGEFGSYLQNYSPADAASKWFTGQPLAQGANKSDILGTTGAKYVAANIKGIDNPFAAPSQAPGPIDPSIIAHGGYSPPIPTTPGTTINSTPAIAGVSQGQWGQLGQNLKNTGKALGLPDDDSGQGQQQVKPSPMIGPQPQARNVSPLLGNPQLYAQRMAAINQPMTWGQGPPGQMAGTGYGAQAQPSVYGMSLMSNLQRLSDPMWMNQMAGGSYG